MPLQKFAIESLATIDDGRIKAGFEMMLDDLIRDCRDRPEHKSKRKLTLTISMEPCSLERGELETVDLCFDLKPSMPKVESRKFNMRAVRGGLGYNELSRRSEEHTSELQSRR